MAYQVPEEHANLLRTMLSLGVEDPLPESVTAAYLAMRRGLDRINAGFPIEFLAVVAVNSGVFGAVGQDAEPPVAAIDWKEIKPGTLVLAGQRAGRFLSTEERGRQGRRQTLVRVQFDEGPHELFAIDQVKIAEEASLASV